MSLGNAVVALWLPPVDAMTSHEIGTSTHTGKVHEAEEKGQTEYSDLGQAGLGGDHSQ